MSIILFISFDKDERGFINYDDFIRNLRGELTENRKKLIHNVFKHLDIDNKGTLSVEELLNIYDAKQSFEFLEEKKSEEEAFNIFEQSLKGNHKYLNGDEADIKPIDLEEFEDFYESVSLMIPNDDLFRNVVLRTWRLIQDEPKEEELNEEQNNNEENINDHDQKQEQNEEKGQNEEPEQEKDSTLFQNLDKSVLTLFNEPSLIQKEEKEESKKQEQEEEPDLIEILVMRLRDLLSERGLVNMISIETGFRNIDTQNAQELDYSKFKQVCDKFDFQLNEEETKELFLAFAKEETTKVNYDEFIRILRGELPENRKELVENVFKSINPENKEELSIEEVFSLYNPKGSYEVLYLKKNEEVARKIFEDTFTENHLYLNGEEGKNKLVDLDEFIDYYESVSLMIRDEDIFREVILKSWNLFKEEVLKKEEKQNEKEIDDEKLQNVNNNIDSAEDNYEKEKEFRKELLGEKNIDLFREALSAKGIKTIINFLNQLKQYDRKGDKEISFPDFFEILPKKVYSSPI